MFSTLNIKIADRLLDELQDGVSKGEGQARREVSRYRRHPTDSNRRMALSALNTLGDHRLAQLRQAARI